MGQGDPGQDPHPFSLPTFQFANLATSLNPLDPDKGR